MRVKRVVLITMLLLSGNIAFADCTYNGAAYPPGTILGPYVCSGNEWVIKK